MISNHFSFAPYFGTNESRALRNALIKRAKGSTPSYPLQDTGENQPVIKAYAKFANTTPAQVLENKGEPKQKPLSNLYTLVQDIFSQRDQSFSQLPAKTAHQEMKKYVPSSYTVAPYQEPQENLSSRQKEMKDYLRQRPNQETRKFEMMQALGITSSIFYSDMNEIMNDEKNTGSITISSRIINEKGQHFRVYKFNP
jgi:hypothetical protein